MNALTTITSGLSTVASQAITTALASNAPNAIAICSALLLLSQPTGASFFQEQPDWKKRFKIGNNIPDSDGSSEEPLAPQYGPFYSAEMKCHTLAQAYFGSQEVSFANPFVNTCPGSHFQPEVYATAVGDEMPTIMQSYVNAVKNLVPPRNAPVTSFPSNMEAFVMNERYLVGNGNRGCDLRDGWAVYENCKQLHDIDSIKTLVKSSYKRDDAFRSNGIPLTIPFDDLNTQIRLHVAINPMIAQNYRAALDLASATMLQDPCFFKKSPDEILEFINELHRKLTEGLPAVQPEADSRMTPGEYRKQFVTINVDQSVEWNPDSIIAQLKKSGISQKDINSHYNSAFQKLIKYHNGGLHPDKTLSKDEKKLISKLFFLPPAHTEIPGLMHNFVVDLKNYASSDTHPVALAAWAHCEFGRIHPFTEANGRLARILMNAILVRGGYEPVVIPDDAKYTAAINSNLETPGAFAKYLGDLIKKRPPGQDLLNRVFA